MPNGRSAGNQQHSEHGPSHDTVVCVHRTPGTSPRSAFTVSGGVLKRCMLGARENRWDPVAELVAQSLASGGHAARILNIILSPAAS